jgi:biopolymer transport protein ExbD
LDVNFKFSKENLTTALKMINEEQKEPVKINLMLNESLTFQDYISIKSQLLEFNLETVQFSNEEFIY